MAFAHRPATLGLSALFGLTCLACAGPRMPSVDPLCGSWQLVEGKLVERWTREGRGLRGESVRSMDEDGREVEVLEQLELIPDRRAYVYVAHPSGQGTTRFAPIEVSDARHELDAPASATRWVWANYEHDFPQEIHYVLVDDRLEATVVGWTDTVAQATGWAFTRSEACSS